MPRNTILENTGFLTDSLRTIESVLPGSWTLRFQEAMDVERGVDGSLEISGPGGVVTAFAVQAKRSGAVTSSTLISALITIASRQAVPLLYLTDYINPVLRAGLADTGISYADATGWIRLVSDEPPILVSSEGASRSPRSRPYRATVRLNGRATSRIIRALLEQPTPLGVRELAALTDTSPGSVSKLLPTLVAEGAVDRDQSGSVVRVRRRVLLQRWTADYSFLNSNSLVLNYVAPRGLDPLVKSLRSRDDVCLTGSAAARTLLPPSTTPVVPLTQLAIYARDIQELASDLGLVPTDRPSSNVLLTTPTDLEIWERALRTPAGLTCAPLGQVLADLLTLPGRSNQEAEQLMDALAATDPAWKD